MLPIGNKSEPDLPDSNPIPIHTRRMVWWLWGLWWCMASGGVVRGCLGVQVGGCGVARGREAMGHEWSMDSAKGCDDRAVRWREMV